MGESRKITILHHLPQTASTGCYPPSQVLGHLTSLPSPANVDSTKYADTLLERTGNHFWVLRKSRQHTWPAMLLPNLWSTILLLGTQERQNLPLLLYKHMRRTVLALKWSRPLTPSQLVLACCPVPLQVSHPTIKGWILLPLQQQTPWRSLFKGGYYRSFSLMWLLRLWSSGLEQLVQNDLKNCTSSCPGQVSFQDQSIC